VDVVIDPKDIELKAARSGGAGGMSFMYCDLL
jgi:protein subunit release factor B